MLGWVQRPRKEHKRVSAWWLPSGMRQNGCLSLRGGFRLSYIYPKDSSPRLPIVVAWSHGDREQMPEAFKCLHDGSIGTPWPRAVALNKLVAGFRGIEIGWQQELEPTRSNPRDLHFNPGTLLAATNGWVLDQHSMSQTTIVFCKALQAICPAIHHQSMD